MKIVMVGKMGGYRYFEEDGLFRRPTDVNYLESFIKTARDKAALLALWGRARYLLRSLTKTS